MHAPPLSRNPRLRAGLSAKRPKIDHSEYNSTNLTTIGILSGQSFFLCAGAGCRGRTGGARGLRAQQDRAAGTDAAISRARRCPVPAPRPAAGADADRRRAAHGVAALSGPSAAARKGERGPPAAPGLAARPALLAAPDRASPIWRPPPARSPEWLRGLPARAAASPAAAPPGMWGRVRHSRSRRPARREEAAPPGRRRQRRRSADRPDRRRRDRLARRADPRRRGRPVQRRGRLANIIEDRVGDQADHNRVNESRGLAQRELEDPAEGGQHGSGRGPRPYHALTHGSGSNSPLRL